MQTYGNVVQSCWRGVLAFFSAASFALTASAETLVIQGSTTFNTRLLAPYGKSIEATTGVTLEVLPNKTTLGLVALLEGRAEMAMISAPLNDELKALRNNKNLIGVDELQEHVIANTRVAFAVHPSNPLRNLSLFNLRRILLGEIRDWREVGGPNLPIRVIYVGKVGGVTHTVRSELLAGAEIAAIDRVPLQTADQVVKVVKQIPGALGLAQLRLVTLENLPELETDGTVSQRLSFVTRGAPSSMAQAVIKAVLLIAQNKLATVAHPARAFSAPD